MSAPAATAALPPRSVAELLSRLLRALPGALLRQLVLLVPLSIGTWLLHTFLLVVGNEGFERGGGVLGQILTARGTYVGGTLVWTLGWMLLVSTAVRLFREGPTAIARDHAVLARSIARHRTAIGPHATAGLVLWLALGLAWATFLDNRVAAILSGLALVSSATLRERSVGVLALHLAARDARRLAGAALPLDPRAPQGWSSPPRIAMGFALAAVGSLVGALDPFAPWCGSLFFVAGLVLAAVLFFTGRTAATMGTLLALFVLGARGALADDGGWVESGGTFTSWIASEGALIAAWLGVPPAIGVAIGQLVGTQAASTGLVPDPWSQAPADGEERVLQGVYGETRIRWDASVGQWVNLERGTWVDPDRWAEDQQQILRDKEWIRGQTEGDRARAEAERAAREAARAAQQPGPTQYPQWYRDFMADRQARLERDQAQANEREAFWSRWTNRVEWVQWGADRSIDALATVTGPAGNTIKWTYTSVRNVGQHLSDAHARGTGYGRALVRGVVETGVDYGMSRARQALTGRIGPASRGNLGLGKWGGPTGHPGFPEAGVGEFVRDAASSGAAWAGWQGVGNAAQGFAAKKGATDPLKGVLGVKR
jgi:hypothetical protein